MPTQILSTAGFLFLLYTCKQNAKGHEPQWFTAIPGSDGRGNGTSRNKVIDETMSHIRCAKSLGLSSIWLLNDSKAQNTSEFLFIFNLIFVINLLQSILVISVYIILHLLNIQRNYTFLKIKFYSVKKICNSNTANIVHNKKKKVDFGDSST